MNIVWSDEEEVLRLRVRFDALKADKKIGQAEFARTNSFPGGASMISQHLHRHRPINLEHATAYAKGFGCSIDDISPRLAAEARAAFTTKSHDYLPEGAVPAALKAAFRVGIVQGGDNGFIEDYTPAPTAQESEPVLYASTLRDEQAYAVKVRGSSMEPTIMVGWDVVASPNRPAEPPDLCVVYFTNGRKALKRLQWRRDGMVCLASISDSHKKITEPVENIIRMDKVISIVPN